MNKNELCKIELIDGGYFVTYMGNKLPMQCKTVITQDTEDSLNSVAVVSLDLFCAVDDSIEDSELFNHRLNEFKKSTMPKYQNPPPPPPTRKVKYFTLRSFLKWVKK